MGGGSADAAALLRVLNEHFKAMGYEELVTLALEIGSDVPFCLKNGTQRVGGLGEKLDRLNDFMLPVILLVAVSGEDVPTPAAYKSLDEKYDNFRNYKPSHSPETLVSALKGSDIKAICDGMYNVFEDVVLPFCPKALYAKETMLNCGALGAMMSGSGSTVFGMLDVKDKDKAFWIQDKLTEKGIDVYFEETVSVTTLNYKMCK